MHKCVQRVWRVCQQQAFPSGCATATQLLHFKEASQSLHLLHFPALNMSLPGKTLPGKMRLPFFSAFAAVMPKQKADKNRGPLPPVERFKNSYSTISQRNVGQIYTSKTHKWWKRTLFNWTKQDKTCKFSRMSSLFKLHTTWNLHLRYTVVQWYNVCWIEIFIVHVGMYDVIDVCSVHLSEHVHYAWNPTITLKIGFPDTEV